MELTEILNSGEVVLVDGSVERHDDIGWEIYPHHSLDHLDCRILRVALTDFEELSYILEHQNTITVDGVAKEIKRCRDIVGAKLSFLPIQANGKKRKKELRGNTRALLEDLQQKIHEVYMLAKNKSQNFTDIRYQALVDMIKLLDVAIGLKRDSSVIYGKHERDQSRDSDTDEKLAAALFYHSFVLGKKASLITKDTDLIRLIGTTPKLIGADDFASYGERFRKAFEESPIKLYLFDCEKDDNQYELVVDSSSYDWRNKKFHISRKTERENEEIYGKMLMLWEKLGDNN